jgi:Protein kinase domain/Pentapeptide repeats (8 copies)
MTQGGDRAGSIAVSGGAARPASRAASIPPSARPSAEHVRALEAATTTEVRLLKKFAQRPLMSVWKGEDKAGKLVLLTVVDACGTPVERERILGAARALLPLAGTDHVQNVYRVQDDVDAFVSDFLGAGAAADLVVLRWPMTRKVDFVCRVAGALAELHEASLVHGCLCPDNILLDDDLHPVLTEVGMVSIKGSLDGDPENFFGYGAYAAPEVMLGQPDVRADIFSVGRLLTFVILDRTPSLRGPATEAPFEGASPEDDLKELHAKNPSLATIVKKCVAAPEGRYASMTELLTDLQRCKQLLVPESSTSMRLGDTSPAVKTAAEAPAKPARSTEAAAAVPRRGPKPPAPKSAAPAWVPVVSMVVVAAALFAVIAFPTKSTVVHLVLQALVVAGAVGITTGLRVTQGGRILMGAAAAGIAIAANPVDHLSGLENNDAMTRATAARAYVMGGGKNLHLARLQIADFSGLDLSGADLEGADLTQSNLARSKLIGARVDGASFLGADLSAADLSKVTLDRVFAIETATCDESTVLPDGWRCLPTHKVRRGTK